MLESDFCIGVLLQKVCSHFPRDWDNGRSMWGGGPSVRQLNIVQNTYTYMHTYRQTDRHRHRRCTGEKWNIENYTLFHSAIFETFDFSTSPSFYMYVCMYIFLSFLKNSYALLLYTLHTTTVTCTLTLNSDPTPIPEFPTSAFHFKASVSLNLKDFNADFQLSKNSPAFRAISHMPYAISLLYFLNFSPISC